ncbi:MAG TPA: lipoyl(octanoyl) transferase LipB [Candidatus Stackebrandtia faecavium]|nr:lipoyl(octanoyl) transferase LipB [Candidatus Stackebrandtia faecavium]
MFVTQHFFRQITSRIKLEPVTHAENKKKLTINRLGTVDYRVAWKQQQELQTQRINDEIADTVLLLEHPSVYTAGRRTEPWTLPTDGTPVVEVDRGGQITWHGPGQLVGYPIIKLPRPIDLVKYVRILESMIMRITSEFGVETTRIAGRTGVWVPADDHGPDRKIAAIGVRVRWAVTLHGFALNCDCDLTHFDRISPCAITDAGVTSLSKELGRQVTVDEVLPVAERHLPEILDD